MLRLNRPALALVLLCQTMALTEAAFPERWDRNLEMLSGGLSMAQPSMETTASPSSSPTAEPVAELRFQIVFDDLPFSEDDDLAAAEFEVALEEALLVLLDLQPEDVDIMGEISADSQVARTSVGSRLLQTQTWSFDGSLEISYSVAQAEGLVTDPNADAAYATVSAANTLGDQLQDAAVDGSFETILETELVDLVSTAQSQGNTYAGLASASEVAAAISVPETAVSYNAAIATGAPTSAPTNAPTVDPCPEQDYQVLPGDSFVVPSEARGTLSGGLQDVVYSLRAILVLSGRGEVFAFGAPITGGTLPNPVPMNVVSIAATLDGFSALTADGAVVSWGDPALVSSFDSVSDRVSSNVISLYATQTHFAALVGSTLVIWGTDSTHEISQVSRVFAASRAFGLVRSANLLAHWPVLAGDIVGPTLMANETVTNVFHTKNAFAALVGDRLEVWGNRDNGGRTQYPDVDVSANVTNVYSNEFAFAALKNDGRLHIWGEPNSGGRVADLSELQNVAQVYNTDSAFVLKRTDDSLYAWGAASSGGTLPDPAPQFDELVSTCCAFAALENQKVVQVWGNANLGGTYPSQLSPTVTVDGVVASDEFFLARTLGGDAVIWGGAEADQVFLDVYDNARAAGREFVAYSQCYSQAPTPAPTPRPTGSPTSEPDEDDPHVVTIEFLVNNPIVQYCAIAVLALVAFAVAYFCCCCNGKEIREENQIFVENFRKRQRNELDVMEMVNV